MQQQEIDIAATAANSIQVAGTHYESEYQHWDMVADVGMGYFDGQITKYISRWRKKNGLQDVQKSLHFAVKYKELLESHRLYPSRREDSLKTANCLIRYLESNNIQGDERCVVTLIVELHSLEDVVKVIQIIKGIAAKEKERLAAEAGPGYTNQG